jgi:hypothetical protein
VTRQSSIKNVSILMDARFKPGHDEHDGYGRRKKREAAAVPRA